MKNGKTILSWGIRIVVAVILFQTLYFKFTGQPESIYIFEKTGLGDAGRYGSGIAELIAGILLLIPGTAWWGALLALGVISGAILSHLTLLGIEVQGDGGTLFALALIVFVGSLATLVLHQPPKPIARYWPIKSGF